MKGKIKMRLNKYISHSGYTSRRKADDLIFQGKVKVNNKIEKNPGYQVDVDKDVVIVEGKELKQDNKIIYIMLNKPTDVITSVDDQFDRILAFLSLAKFTASIVCFEYLG